MSFYAESKLDIFKEKFKKELKSYDSYRKQREDWISTIDNINSVQHMSPEIMALAFAYISELLSELLNKKIYDRAFFDDIDDIDTFLKNINNSVSIKRFEKIDDQDKTIMLYITDMDNKIISKIIKNTQSNKNSELSNWPFSKNKFKSLKLKIELAAYIKNILTSYKVSVST